MHRRVAIAVLAVSLSGCVHLWRNFTGEGNPVCKPACLESEECRFEWVLCDPAFGYSCEHSVEAICFEAGS